MDERLSPVSGVRSCVRNRGGVPALFINGSPVPAAAYLCYLDGRERYGDFARAGYSLYSFPSYFAGKGINADSGIGPFRSGIFDRRGDPDFAVFDRDVERILSADPQAFLFPRVCLDMPEWWEREFPEELNGCAGGGTCRVSMSSEQWRRDAGDMLAALIRHVEQSPYAARIIGYQPAAGGTEEWVHFRNRDGGLGMAAQQGFARYVFRKYGGREDALRAAYRDGAITFGAIRIPEDYGMYAPDGPAFFDISRKMLLDFLEYTNHIIADDILYFCRLIKKHTHRRLVTGAFYGYSLALTDARNGHLALGELLASRDIDFLCSPNWYNRSPGVDWPCMLPLDSIKAAGKLFFSECDTRTHLTRPLKEARPSIAPAGWYEGGVWEGPEREDVSLWLIRKCFTRNLIQGTGLWWFDMWGGWYASETLMDELGKYPPLLEESLRQRRRGSVSQVAVITDADSQKYFNTACGIAQEWVSSYPLTLGSCGVPYDIFDLGEADRIDIGRCRLVLITGICRHSAELDSLVRRCREAGVHLCFTYLPGSVRDDMPAGTDLSSALTGIGLRPADRTDETPILDAERGGAVLAARRSFAPGAEIADPEAEILGHFEGSGRPGFVRKKVGGSTTWYCALPGMTAQALRMVFGQAGVHLYCREGDVLYANRRFLCIHSAFEGEKEIILPSRMKAVRLLDSGSPEIFEGDRFTIFMKRFETCLFRITPVSPISFTNLK